MQPKQTTEGLSPSEAYYVRAETFKRFLNYLIDVVFFYLLIYIVSSIMAMLFPSLFENDTEYKFKGYRLVYKLMWLTIYAVYMGLMEGFCKGKSLGKLITATRAVNLDGSRITVGTALARGFSRAVPFSVFSAFGTPCDPWQDNWTHTMVIDERESIVQLPSAKKIS
jgi:uncharacterized RDD family membrane protein YckC